MQDISSKTKRRRYARSSSFMMALLFTVLCGAVALCLGYFINYFAKGHFVHGTRAIIDSEIKYIDALGGLPSPQQQDGRLYIPLDDQGTLPEGFSAPNQVLAEGLLVLTVPDTGVRYAARIHTLDNADKILIGTDITDMAYDYRFMQWIGIASIAFVMIVVFVSYLISIFVVKGTNKIAATAHDIMRTGDLSRRVHISARWDDLSNVALALNTLLDRVESLMHGLRQVSDNIAHDLRTPLTRMRNHIENLQQTNPDHEAYTKLLDEADHILNTFNALLRISRIETEQQRSQFTHVRLDHILKDIVEFYDPLAEDKNITLSTRLIDAPYHGDRDLLFQAFANITDNAIKYTPQGGTVRISIDCASGHGNLCVRIENSGVHLPDADLAHIFDRFYRADSSRSKPGTGLGLSLVSAVMILHDGRVMAENTADGFQIITYL